MSLFQPAIDALFTDPNLSTGAVWRAMAVPATSGVAVRVIAKAPDAELQFGQGRVALPALILRVRVSEVPQARRGDLVEHDGALWRAMSDGVLDREELVWSVDLETAP